MASVLSWLRLQQQFKHAKTKIPLRRLSPKLLCGESRGHKSWKSQTQMVTNHEIMKFRWKSPTQITKVADTNHLDMSRCLQQSPWQVRDKPFCLTLMEFSPLQCTGKVGDKVQNKFPTKSRTCSGHKSWKSVTWFVLRTFMICVRDKSATLSETCSGLCRKVGVMEFGLKLQC